MKFDPAQHHRRSIRARGYDYSKPGAYFVTICVNQHECLFGEVIGEAVQLNECGKIVWDEWTKTPTLRPDIDLDVFVVMPNHLHGILIITDRRRGVLQYAPTFRSPSQTIGALVRGFKSAVTKRINEMRNTPGVAIWQRNYYDHIVRNDDDLLRCRQYILDNPLKWELDENHPDVFNGTSQR